MRKYYKAEMGRLLRVLTRVVWALLLLPPVAMGMIHWASEKSPGLEEQTRGLRLPCRSF